MVASQARRSWRWSRNIESVWHWKHLLITASRPGLDASVGCCAAAAATNMSPPNRPPKTAFSWAGRNRRIIGVSLPKLRGADVNAGRPAIHQDSHACGEIIRGVADMVYDLKRPPSRSPGASLSRLGGARQHQPGGRLAAHERDDLAGEFRAGEVGGAEQRPLVGAEQAFDEAQALRDLLRGLPVGLDVAVRGAVRDHALGIRIDGADLGAAREEHPRPHAGFGTEIDRALDGAHRAQPGKPVEK